MKFLKYRALASRIVAGNESVATMCRREREKLGLVCSAVMACSAGGCQYGPNGIYACNEGHCGTKSKQQKLPTLLVLARVQAGLEQLRERGNIGGHDDDKTAAGDRLI